MTGITREAIPTKKPMLTVDANRRLRVRPAQAHSHAIIVLKGNLPARKLDVALRGKPALEIHLDRCPAPPGNILWMG